LTTTTMKPQTPTHGMARFLHLSDIRGHSDENPAWR
jgi:hypothetical protein